MATSWAVKRHEVSSKCDSQSIINHPQRFALNDRSRSISHLAQNYTNHLKVLGLVLSLHPCVYTIKARCNDEYSQPAHNRLTTWRIVATQRINKKSSISILCVNANEQMSNSNPTQNDLKKKKPIPCAEA